VNKFVHSRICFSEEVEMMAQSPGVKKAALGNWGRGFD
jgi:hypothetical protein